VDWLNVEGSIFKDNEPSNLSRIVTLEGSIFKDKYLDIQSHG